MDRISRRDFLAGLGKGAGAGALVLATPTWLREAVAEAQTGIPANREMEAILTRALARGGHYADLYLETSGNLHIVVADSEVRTIEYGIVQGGGVRTLSGERTGYAYAETFDPGALAEVADSASQIASGSSRARPTAATEISFPRVVHTRRPIAAAPVAEKLQLIERMDRAAREVSPHVKQVRIDYRDASQAFTVINSDGLLARDELPVIYVRVNVNAARGESVAEGMHRASFRMGMEQLDGQTPEEIGRAAAEQAVRMLDAQPAPAGEMPVVIAAGGGVMFHEAVGHGLEADAVLRDSTVFAGRVGERVGSELVNLSDDATIPGLRGSFNVDDEGSVGERTLLIEKGVLKGYMQSRRTAYNMRTVTSGNGRRMSFRHPAIVRMSNTDLWPGKADPEEIVKETRRGIYAAEFGGGEVDTASGQFTFGLREAYLIEDGRIGAPIRGAVLAGSGPEIIKRIDRTASDFGSWPGTCGKDGQWVPVTSGCPTLRVSAITVGGTA